MSEELPKTETLKVDLAKIKPTTLKVDSLMIGEFVIKAVGDSLYFDSCGGGDVYINGKSFNKINEVLENHYNALKKLIEQK